ncbi:uncharacterized protein F5Z01DRAFT_646390 [Emericellopsis atlantica]|uniref:2EXR domain-containing protein n=1 Tax=Emericellopsis atlantica TaxID=2614577 RepID=A0A9P7ZSS1_9HYPO|nr:uncharacterized protein F5Z01DRAFT_646390 [Emericellopsis atlantica]KAG9257575.1 hypothetical protein F5Z01DRAFT_646390 [Emericellopsis atlantica]
MFTLFPQLPTEIRLQIWREASLPSIRVPRNAVVPFDSRWYFATQGGDPPIKVQCTSPWAIHVVNHEARGVTEELAAELGLAWETVQPYKYPILTRDFLPEEDLVYLPRHGIMRTLLPDILTLAQQHDDTHWVNRSLSRIRHLLLPAFTAYYSIELIVRAIEDMPNLERVYVAWGVLPEIFWRETEQLPDHPWGQEYDSAVEIDVQPQWTLEYLPPVPGDYVVPDEEDEDEAMPAEGDVEVEMVVDDEMSDKRWVEKGSLWDWMSEISDAINILELGDNFTSRFTDDEGEVTLDIVPVTVVVDGDTVPDLAEGGGGGQGRYWCR